MPVVFTGDFFELQSANALAMALRILPGRVLLEESPSPNREQL
jgi:hypothetical protein